MSFITEQVTNLIKLIDYKINSKPLSPNVKLGEVYEKWSAEKWPTISERGVMNYITVWNKIPDKLKKKKFVKLTRKDWQNLISIEQTKGNGFDSQKRIRMICSQLYKYAINNELLYNNIAPTLEICKHKMIHEKSIYSDLEIQTLYENRNKSELIDSLLILIFTGMRISEFLNLNPNEDIFLDDDNPYLIVRQSKTEAGRNRPIPIFEKIYPILKRMVEEAQKENRDYLLKNVCGRRMRYSSFALRTKRMLKKKFGIKHTIHETRHTFASIMDGLNANDMAIKKIMGHAARGVTKKTYTHKNIASLFEAIDLLDNNYLLDKEEIELAKKEIDEAIKEDADFEISEPLKVILMRDPKYKFLAQKRKKKHFIRKTKERVA